MEDRVLDDAAAGVRPTPAKLPEATLDDANAMMERAARRCRLTSG